MGIRSVSYNSMLSGQITSGEHGPAPSVSAQVKSLLPPSTPVRGASPSELLASRRGIGLTAQQRSAMQNNFANVTEDEQSQPPLFQTSGGTWRIGVGDEHPRFYPDGADTSGTTRFDREYYQAAQGEWVHLNARGALSRQPKYQGQARPDGTTDFDWKGWEKVDVARVPGEYSAEGKTITFQDAGKSSDQDIVLKKYLVQVVGVNWYEDTGMDAVHRARSLGVKVELEEAGKSDAGETIYKVKLDGESQDKLRQVVAEMRGEVVRLEQAGREGQTETNEMLYDWGRLHYNVGANTVNGATEPLRAGLEMVGVRTAPLARVEYQSQVMRKNHTGEVAEIAGTVYLNTRIGGKMLATRAGKAVIGTESVYNIAAGASGKDITTKDEQGNAREMSPLEQKVRMVGGILGAASIAPRGITASTNGTPEIKSEVFEAVTPDGQTMRLRVPVKNEPPISTDAKMVSVDETGAPSGLRFRDDFRTHIIERDFSVPRKSGIGGAHNLDEFNKYLNEIRIVNRTPHPSVPGVEKIEYKIPTLDRASKPDGGWSAKTYTKTVYDPKIISDAQMLEWGQQAYAEAQSAGRFVNAREWVGTAPNGITFRGFVDDSGAVRSFFPDF